MTWVRFKVACTSSSRLLQYNTKKSEYTRYKICLHKLHPHLWARHLNNKIILQTHPLHHTHSWNIFTSYHSWLIGAVYWFCACFRWWSPSTRNIWVCSAISDMFCILRYFVTYAMYRDCLLLAQQTRRCYWILPVSLSINVNACGNISA
jgi:hypothetical protein